MFIPSKVINLEEEWDKVLRWVISQFPSSNGWKISWYDLNENELLYRLLVGVLGVVTALDLNIVLVACR